MVPSADELAGIADTFGGLTRDELTAAVADLAARTGADLDRSALDRAIEKATDEYYLLSVDPEAVSGVGEAGGGPDVLVPGPAALPTLPDGGEDLPHLLELAPRDVDRAATGSHAVTRLRTDAERAVDEGDSSRAERLLDVCYEVESWGQVDLSGIRADLAELVD